MFESVVLNEMRCMIHQLRTILYIPIMSAIVSSFGTVGQVSHNIAWMRCAIHPVRKYVLTYLDQYLSNIHKANDVSHFSYWYGDEYLSKVPITIDTIGKNVISRNKNISTENERKHGTRTIFYEYRPKIAPTSVFNSKVIKIKRPQMFITENAIKI